MMNRLRKAGYDRKGHVRFEVAGAGDGFTVELVRHRQTKETVTDRLHLRDTAPVLDPTFYLADYRRHFEGCLRLAASPAVASYFFEFSGEAPI